MGLQGGGEGLFERGPASRQVLLDGTGRRPHGFGAVRDGEIGEVVQNDGLPLPAGEGPQRLCEIDVLGDVMGDIDLLPSETSFTSQPAPPAATQVEGDGAQPGVGPGRADLVSVLPGAGQSLLGRIRRRLGVERREEAQPQQRPLLLTEELVVGHRHLNAPASRPDDTGVEESRQGMTARRSNRSSCG